MPVTDEALTQCIRTLRRKLGDDANRPRFIETVPKHGYRFIAPVEWSNEGPAKVVDRAADARRGANSCSRMSAGIVGGGGRRRGRRAHLRLRGGVEPVQPARRVLRAARARFRDPARRADRRRRSKRRRRNRAGSLGPFVGLWSAVGGGRRRATRRRVRQAARPRRVHACSSDVRRATSPAERGRAHRDRGRHCRRSHCRCRRTSRKASSRRGLRRRAGA